jgi:hypothetical protein
MPQGSWDAFVLKIKNCTNSTATDVINSCTPITWIDGNTYTTNNFNAQDTLSTADGCDSVITLNLTITTIDTSINKSGNTLTANATGVSYQWVRCDNNYSPLSGETNQSFTPSSNGSYAVVINSGACTDTSNCYTFSVLATNDLFDKNISVFPNPSSGQLNIRTDKPLSLRLYNQIGQIIFDREITNTQQVNTLSLNGISSGVYIFSLSNQSQIVTRGKLILE